MPILPSFFAVFVCEGQNIRGTSAAVANHHGDRRVFSEVLQHNRNHIRAAFHHKAHDRDTLAQPCNTTTLGLQAGTNITNLSKMLTQQKKVQASCPRAFPVALASTNRRTKSGKGGCVHSCLPTSYHGLTVNSRTSKLLSSPPHFHVTYLP